MNQGTLPKIGARYMLNGSEYEVTSTDGGFVTLRGLNSKTNRFLEIAKFIENVYSGIIKLSVPAPIQISEAPNVLGLTEKQRKLYERKVAYVVRLEREVRNSISKPALMEFINEISKTIKDPIPPSYESIMRWLRDYHKQGGNPLKLVDKRKGQSHRKRLDSEALEVINDYIKTEYLKDTRPSVQLVYDLVKSQLTVNNQKRPPDRQLVIPSRATFYRTIAALDPFYVDRKREGKYVANKNYKYGKGIHKTTRLCERVEADSHLMDVLIVTDDRKAVIGRPWLCAMIDVDSRCIIGWEISFTPPCAAKVLRALRFAMAAENDWETSGAPEELVLDNGSEFRNYVLQLVAGTYGVQLRYVSPRSPDQKPHIERFFGTLNTQLIHLMSGTTRSNPTARGDYDSKVNATFTMAELKEKFTFWLRNIYHETKHGSLGIAPIDAWRNKSKYYPPNRYPTADLDLTCRPFVYRTISGGRISYERLQWSSPSLSSIAMRAKQLGNDSKVKVYYDETDLFFVFVEDPSDRTNLIRADAVDPTYQNGLSLYEHKLMIRKRRLDYRDSDNVELSKVKLEFYRELSASASTANIRKILARLQKGMLDLEDKSELVNQPDTAQQAEQRPPEEDEGNGDYEGYVL